MTPAEVIAMRDKLTEWFKEVGWIGAELEMELADKMIREGWVVAPPKNEATCTCPTGDGSLRWPCKVHPPKNEGENK